MGKCYASNAVKIANKYVGYMEKETNKDLDSFTDNVGDENYTKFAREYKEFTGVNFQGQAWCDQFIDAILVEAFGKIKAKELLGGFSAYTPTSAQYFKNMNQWHTKNPEVGDVIFFENNIRIHHTGLVINVSSTKVYTIEGNTSGGSNVEANGGGVFKKEYLLSNGKIAGYGRPNYDKIVEPVKEPIKEAPVVKPVVKPTTASTKYFYEYYVIKGGDNLLKIAKEYNTTVDNLVKLNNIKQANDIDIGRKLLTNTYPLYTVIKGDTLSKISLKLLGDFMRYKEIKELNKMKDTYIDIGQELKIPNK